MIVDFLKSSLIYSLSNLKISFISFIIIKIIIYIFEFFEFLKV